MKYRDGLKGHPYIRAIYIFAFRFFSPYDKYNYGLFKYFGLHLVRLLMAFGRTACGRLVMGLIRGNATFAACGELQQNGVSVLTNFLNDLEISNIRKIIQDIEVGMPPEGAQIFKQDGASYIFANITDIIDPMKVAHIQNLCENYLGHARISELMFWLHGVEDIDISAEGAKEDINLLWHTDTFHPTVKGFLYLDPLEEAEGPFEYMLGSHRITLRRLLFEFISSVKNFSTQGFRAPEPLAIYPSNRANLFTGLGNALIVADTFGLHRRGRRIARGKRYSVHFSCRTNPYKFFARVQG